MVTKSIVTARKYNSGEVIDVYVYERPLDKIGKDCLSLWMNMTEFLNPKCSFESNNIKDDINLVIKCKESPIDNECNLFYREIIIEEKRMVGL
jgi:hypothetical protein